MNVVGPVRTNVDLPSPHAILFVPERTVRVCVNTVSLPVSEPVRRVEFNSFEVVAVVREPERLGDANEDD